jgi:hypothetical protein
MLLAGMLVVLGDLPAGFAWRQPLRHGSAGSRGLVPAAAPRATCPHDNRPWGGRAQTALSHRGYKVVAVRIGFIERADFGFEDVKPRYGLPALSVANERIALAVKG